MLMIYMYLILEMIIKTMYVITRIINYMVYTTNIMKMVILAIRLNGKYITRI